jgi:hypothetical protein
MRIRSQHDRVMTTQLQIALVVLALFVVYVAAKVRLNMRRSEREWRQVDKSKLRDWEYDG